jgi:hypothetical protein
LVIKCPAIKVDKKNINTSPPYEIRGRGVFALWIIKELKGLGYDL